MPAVETESRAILQRLQQADDAAFRLTPDAGGALIELRDSGLAFYHSFISGPLKERARQPGQALLRACNDRKRSLHRVLDLTAGWGADSLTLATHGQQVTLLEQNEVVFAVTAHALDCLRNSAGDHAVAMRMLIHHANALAYLRQAGESEQFDCIYIDPMFPAHRSGAKPAKEMQILQALASNVDLEEGFEIALTRARRRVVVKQPAKAPWFTGSRPDLDFRDKTVRFDVYLTA